MKYECWNWILNQQEEYQDHNIANRESKDQHWLKKYLNKINTDWTRIFEEYLLWLKFVNTDIIFEINHEKGILQENILKITTTMVVYLKKFKLKKYKKGMIR